MVEGKHIVIILVFLIIFSVIGAVIIMVYFNKVPAFLRKEELVGEQHYNYTSMVLKAKYMDETIKVDYMLNEEAQTVASGILYPDKLEKFNEIRGNFTYYLYTWDYDGTKPDYYLNWVRCPSGWQTCETSNIKMGDIRVEIEKKADRLYILSIIAENGSVYKPTVCMAWTRAILDVKMPLNERNPPTAIRRKYDKCFTEPETVTGKKDYEVVVYFYNQVQDDSIKFLILDKPLYLDDNNILQESYFYKGEDMGTKNVELTMYFTQK